MIALVLGTRPEAIKLAPVALELRRRGVEHKVVGVRQHPDLVKAALAEFGLEVDRWAGQPTSGLANFVGAALADVASALSGCRLAVVQGDTSSAVAGMLAAHATRVPVAHVEAGLRTEDPWEPWPEEWNRRLIDHGSQLWFAPTIDALAALRQEGLDGQLTGNTGIDALLWMRDEVRRHGAPALFGRPGILASVHRREAWGAPLQRVVEALAELSADCPVVFLHHPSPAVEEAAAPLRGLPGVRFCAPQDYATVVRALDECRLVVTDSGGLQEEAPSLGRPVLIARERTERPEVVEAGIGEVVGFDSGRIVEAARRRLAEDPPDPVLLFGNGRAAPRVVDAALHFLGE